VEHTLVKDSSQVPQNKSLKICHQNIRGLGNTVIPRLTKIIRSGITFVSRNVILYKYIIHFVLLN